MKDNRSIINNLEVPLSGKNEGLTMMVVNESSKLPFFDGGGRFVDGNEEVGGNGIIIENAHQKHEINNINAKDLSKKGETH